MSKKKQYSEGGRAEKNMCKKVGLCWAKSRYSFIFCHRWADFPKWSDGGVKSFSCQPQLLSWIVVELRFWQYSLHMHTLRFILSHPIHVHTINRTTTGTKWWFALVRGGVAPAMPLIRRNCLLSLPMILSSTQALQIIHTRILSGTELAHSSSFICHTSYRNADLLADINNTGHTIPS